jgi:hypothetical protein
MEANMTDLHALCAAMIDYDAGDPHRVHHFLKVWAFSKAIGEAEGLDRDTLHILEAAALTHDIGIKPSQRKYHSAAGEYQELEGPPEARRCWRPWGRTRQPSRASASSSATTTPTRAWTGRITRSFWRRNFLVNAYEGGLDSQAIRAAGRNSSNQNRAVVS